MPGDKKKAPKTIVSNTGNAFTVIEDFEDGTDPKGRQMQMTRFGQQTVEFVMTKWPMWNAVVNTHDVSFISQEIKKPGFEDINLQQKEHPVYMGKTYLIAAVQANQLEIVNLLLENGADPNLIDDTGKTAMHYSIVLNYLEIYELLIKNPRTNVNQIVNNNNALLHVLMSEGKKDWAEKLVAHGADINLHTEDLATPLVQTLAGSQTECALWLLGLGADVRPGFDGISPMCFAAASGLIDIMEALLSKGATLNKEEYATTPLISAARNNKVEAVKWILSKGADTNVADNDGDTPAMHGACNIEILNALLEKGAKIDTEVKPQRYLFNAATNGSSKCLALFLETYKMDANTTNEVGQTAISEAATCDATDSENKVEHIDVLIKHGADVNKADTRRGTTPLLHAVFHRKLDNISRLLQAGASPNAQDVDGLTPLHMACGRGYLEEAKLLVGAGGDVHIKDANGESPAEFAASTFPANVINEFTGGNSPRGTNDVTDSPSKKKDCLIS